MNLFTVYAAEICDPDEGYIPLSQLGDFIINIAGVMLLVGGIIFFVMMIFGGFKYMGAGGDFKNVQSAKATFVYGVIGFVLLAAAWLIVKFIGSIFGLTEDQILTLGMQEVFEALGVMGDRCIVAQ